LREDESVSKKRVKNAQMRKRTATATYWQPFYGALTDFAIGQTSLLSRSSWMAVYVCVLVAKKKERTKQEREMWRFLTVASFWEKKQTTESGRGERARS
jgi:protein-S-isoprenylcysteine O-methyltransferase Ste14